MIIEGVIKALKGEDWESDFDLSPRGLPLSFLAVLAYLPFYFICVKASVTYNAVDGYVPYLAIAVVLTLMALSFPIVSYILCMVLNRMEAFRPWVIVRNWTMLFVIMAMSAGFGLYLIGLIPFGLAYMLGMFIYLSTLVVDIRLARVVAGFDWLTAIFSAILVAATAMMILLLGLTQNL